LRAVPLNLLSIGGARSVASARIAAAGIGGFVLVDFQRPQDPVLPNGSRGRRHSNARAAARHQRQFEQDFVRAWQPLLGTRTVLSVWHGFDLLDACTKLWSKS
jgi:hypothetical protein